MVQDGRRRNFHPLTASHAADYFAALRRLFVTITPPPASGPWPLPSLLAGGSALPAPRRAPLAPVNLCLRPEAADRALEGDGWITAALREPGFPVVLGQFLAHHCDLSYERPRWAGAAEPAVPPSPLRTHQCSFNQPPAQGFGFVFERHVFVIFRGSDSWADWRQNFRAWHECEGPDPGADADDALGIKVHAGFRRSLDLLWPAVQCWLETLPPLRGIILSGHSLGGAMAVLAAWRLQRQGRRVAGVITFGAPRVGNAAFARSCTASGLDRRIWRVVWGGDPVPHVPPALGYCHIGSQEAIASPRQLERHPVRALLSGRSNDYWRLLSIALSGRNAWIYGALRGLPFALGAYRSGREHERALGYSNAHAALADAALARLGGGAGKPGDVSQAHEASTADGELQLRRLLHRAYITGAADPPAPGIGTALDRYPHPAEGGVDGTDSEDYA